MASFIEKASLSAILSLFLIVQIYCWVEFRNLKCVTRDKEYAEFEYCYLKSINRTYKYASLKVVLHELPVYNFSTNIAILKRENGYKPFLYNVTIDGCKFLRKSTNPVYKYFGSLFVPFTNIKSCPIQHDVILEKLSISHLNKQLTVTLPMPDGDYAIYTTWFAYGISMADVILYLTIS